MILVSSLRLFHSLHTVLYGLLGYVVWSVCARVHACACVSACILVEFSLCPVVWGHRRVTVNQFSTPCRMRTTVGLSGRWGPVSPPGLAGPSWADTPKSCSWWSGSAGCSALDRTRVTHGPAVSLALVERHYPMCLGASSSQLPAFCFTFLLVWYSRLAVESH